MGEYKKIIIDFKSDIICNFLEYKENYCSILIADFDGKVGFGSSGKNDADYMYHRLGEHILYIFPFAILFDLRDLEYEYGNSILKIFDAVTDINFSDVENLIPRVLLLSDKCIYGLSTLIGFDVNNLPEWIFTDYDKALNYSVKKAIDYSDA